MRRSQQVAFVSLCLIGMERRGVFEIARAQVRPDSPRVKTVNGEAGDAIAAGPYSVSGTVVDVRVGTGIGGARVYLRSAASSSTSAYVTLSDTTGRFRFEGIRAGKYAVLGVHDLYVSSEYGPERGKPNILIDVDPEHKPREVVIRLTAPSAVAGRIVDSDGAPLARAVVQCYRVTYESGHRRLSQAYGAVTNDLGEYRVFGMSPASYIVVATYRAPLPPPPIAPDQLLLSPAAAMGALEGYLPVHFPDSLNSETARPLIVRAGADLRGIDLRLVRTRTPHIRGTVVSSTGVSVRYASVLLWRVDDSGRALSPPENTRTNTEGSFQFGDVAPGLYFAGIIRTGEGAREEAWKSFRVKDIDLKLEIVLSPITDLKGLVETDDGTLTLPGLKITLEALLLGGNHEELVTAERKFAFKGVPPGAYDVSVTGDRKDLYIKSIRLGDTDHSSSTLELTQNNLASGLFINVGVGGGEVGGVVTCDDTSKLATAVVVLVPDPPRRELGHLYKASRLDGQKHFTLTGIAPGAYRLFAWQEIEQDRWMDTDFISSVEPLSQEVTVGLFSQRTVTIPLILKKQ